MTGARRWSEREWPQVLSELATDGRVNAVGMTLSANDVDRLLAAAPKRDGRRCLTKAGFTGTSFGDGVRFTSVSFDQAVFAGASFGNSVVFANAKFADVGFTGANFGDSADFTDARFGDSAHFDGAVFGRGADFSRAKFGSKAMFPNARFGDGANFTAAQFGNGVFFEGASFGRGVMFPRATFGEGAFFEVLGGGLMLQGAIFDEADLPGAALRDADLQGASLRGCRLEGCDLRSVLLGDADLRRASFSFRTSLEGARFFTDREGKPTTCGPLLGDVRWNDVQISGVVDWNDTSGRRLGEDPFSVWPQGLASSLTSALSRSVSRPMSIAFCRWLRRVRAPETTSAEDRAESTALVHGKGIIGVVEDPEVRVLPTHPGTEVRANRQVATLLRQQGITVKVIDFESDEMSTRLADAIRAYRQVATLLREQGMVESARGFDYRASQLTRRVLPDINSWPGWLRWVPCITSAAKRFLSFILDLASRYGYSPTRVFATYVATVVIFAAIYRFTGITGWDDAIPFSLIAFHGRGVINGPIGPKDPYLWIPAIEAVVGLLIEALLVATIIRRLFRQ
jgi:uncharacterized protein YjbI with pentapeptide repeats